MLVGVKGVCSVERLEEDAGMDWLRYVILLCAPFHEDAL
jgi:hypothetical protein